MFWRILKKDMKRKKTMNIILLLFVIMSAMFAAASVNNISAVTGGIDKYFDEAGVTDAIVYVNDIKSDAEEKLKKMPSVTEIRAENNLCIMSAKSFSCNGKQLDNFINPAYIISDSEMGMKYFDEKNNVINSVEQGYFYCTAPFIQNFDIKEGNEVTLSLKDTKLKLKYKGRFKGAVFSNENSASPYLIVNSADYKIAENSGALSDSLKSKMLYVNTSDIEAVNALAENDTGLYIDSREGAKSIYLYDMLAAYIMLSISIILMLTAFVVLRFAINFTITEEFREIGVMKAVGIDNTSIRSLYIAKYFGISVAGAVIGAVCSIPLSGMMLRTVSENMVLSSKNSVLMGILSSAAVVAIIMLFCYGCTGKINRFSPIDAVRSGQTGERFKKKSILHLGKSKLPSTGFLSLNDVMSAPKQFGIITMIFTLCMLMMTIMSNFALTLQSDKISWLFNIPENTEATILDVASFQDLFYDTENYSTIISDTEKMLAENNISGKCSMTMQASCEAFHGDKKAKIYFIVSKGNLENKLICDEGSAPQKNDEIALTGYAMNDLNAKIGDRITARISGKEYEFIITGKFSTFMGSGHSAFLNKDFSLGSQHINGSTGIQIHFDNAADEETVSKNIEVIKNAIDSDKVYTTPEMIGNVTGMGGTLEAIKKVMMILTIIISSMIVILMERSFISKEKSEIALMKAVGINNISIISQHTLRFAIISVVACIVSLAVMMPVSNVIMSNVFSLIGDVSDVKCTFDPKDIFIVCPAILISVTVLGSALTALYTNTIKASDASSIE